MPAEKPARTIIKCKSIGVRYREHPTRKHGVKPDKYFLIRYKLDGKDREEGLGWASEGVTEAKASARLSELKEAQRTGQGHRTLAAKREAQREREEAERLEREEATRAMLTFGQLWPRYFTQAQADKSPKSCEKEEQCFRLWIAPVIGDKPLKDVAPFHLERIKKAMADAGRAPRSAAYTLAVVRQIFNFAKRHGLFEGDNPTSKVKKPTSDNRRLRFLTHDEAQRLLDALAARSPGLRDRALISLHCGLRAGEVFTLTWPDVDFVRGILTLRDTKSGKTRQVPMTRAVQAMLEQRPREGALVFPGRGGVRAGQISESFNRAVADLGLNDGIADSRQKVVFHTLRHTFASWLVAEGVDLYTVKELMGHATLAMTERYSHLAPENLRRAVDLLEAAIPQETGKGKKSSIINMS
ncbi:MAG: integrase family [Desulfovibrionaceae bacterium]|nr:MAG: integrase family [Desulfovibrionaceae bacterium]